MGGSRSGDGYRQGVAKQESSSVGNGQEVLGAGQGVSCAVVVNEGQRRIKTTRAKGGRELGGGRERDTVGWLDDLRLGIWHWSLGTGYLFCD